MGFTDIIDTYIIAYTNNIYLLFLKMYLESYDFNLDF